MKHYYSKDLDREIVVLNFDNREFKVPRVLNHRYEVSGILSVGGMGVIFIAKDTKLLDKKVLIKRSLYPSSLFMYKNDSSREDQIALIRESMETEYTAMIHGWARNIPNIPIPLDRFDDLNPEVYGPHKDKVGNTFFGEKEIYETEPYVVINYFSGKTVKSDHNEVQKNIIGFCEYYLKSVANILSRFHEPYSSKAGELSFYYCDMKPGNVILTKEKQIVLIDMGSFSILVDGEVQNNPATTPGYCAPELAEGQVQHISPAVDVYTLAVTVFELVTGKQPVVDQYGNIELDWKKFKEIVREANAIHWITIFEKALQPLPQNRYSTLDDFTAAFDKNPRNQGLSYKKKHKKKSLYKKADISSSWAIQRDDITISKRMLLPIINFPIWREEKLFYLRSSASAINQNYKLSSLHQNLLQDLFEKSLNNLVKNKTYLPELLELTKNGTCINYVPAFFNTRNIRDDILKSNLEKLIYLFFTCKNSAEMLVGLTSHTIRFDLLGNPFINQFWLLFNKSEKYLLENPEIQQVIGGRVILPPELRESRSWDDEKSFSYLAGIFVLLAVCPGEVYQLYRSNRLTSKIDYERLIRGLLIADELKEIILLLINPNQENRPTLFEALSKLKERKNAVVKRARVESKLYGIKIQSTEKLGYYKIQHRQINIKVQKFIKFYQIENYILLNREPTGRFKTGLENSKCQPIVSPKNYTTEVKSLLQDAIKKKQTKVAILIFDQSILSMQAELESVLSEFSKVLLFSKSNPFNLKNLDFFPLDNYMIRR